MKRKFFLLMVVIIIIVIGPTPDTPEFNSALPEINLSLPALADSIRQAEAAAGVKPNNEARIVWADSVRQTDWAIVYLHGFTASQMEGDPVHRDLARKFGMNLYLTRLSDHGLVSDSALYYMTPDRLWESAKRALVIGRKLGKKVILMSTSTGGTLALKLAEQYPDLVDALVNYSPNIRINQTLGGMLNAPWSVTFLRLAMNGYMDYTVEDDSLVSQYWNSRYRVEALPQLEELVETTMTEETFQQITCPVLTVAYYQDDDHQDPTVKVSAMRWMNENLATPAEQKRYVELATVGVHPLASGIRSKDIPAVEKTTIAFFTEVLGIPPVE